MCPECSCENEVAVNEAMICELCGAVNRRESSGKTVRWSLSPRTNATRACQRATPDSHSSAQDVNVGELGLGSILFPCMRSEKRDDADGLSKLFLHPDTLQVVDLDNDELFPRMLESSGSAGEHECEKEARAWAAGTGQHALGIQQRLLLVVARRWTHAFIAAAWSQWQQQVHLSRRARRGLRAWLHLSLSSAWNAWCAHVHARRRLAAACVKAAEITVRRGACLLESCLVRWLGAVQARRCVGRVVGRWRGEHVAKAFLAWDENAAAARGQRERGRRAVLKWMSGCVAKSLEKWRLWVSWYSAKREGGGCGGSGRAREIMQFIGSCGVHLCVHVCMTRGRGYGNAGTVSQGQGGGGGWNGGAHVCHTTRAGVTLHRMACFAECLRFGGKSWNKALAGGRRSRVRHGLN